MNISIPYGKKTLRLSLSRARLAGVLKRSPAGGRRKDASDLALAALKGKTIPRGKNVLIVVPDTTRSAHLKDILPVLLGKTHRPSRKIDIIVATGLHKKHTDGELADLVGRGVFKRHKVMCHDQTPSSLGRFGSTSLGVPVALNRKIKDYELVISIGVIEPHLYAGYSGGAKTVAIGLAGEETINATHNVRFLDDPLTKLGFVKDNPFQRTLWEIVKDIPLEFSVNTVNDPDGHAVKIFAGPTRDVFQRGYACAKKIIELETPRGEADAVICGIGYPKDINLYQASRAINYILNVERPVLKRGGVLIVAAELKDGAGEGVTEKRFYDELKNMDSPSDFANRIKNTSCVSGVHRAYMVAKPLIDYKIAFTGLGEKSFMEGLPFPYFKDIRGALEYADSLIGKDSKIYVVPRALATIAQVR